MTHYLAKFCIFVEGISSILSLKFLFVKWFLFHLYLSILTCKFQEVRILNVTSPNTFQNRRNETACILAFLSPSYANQMRAQSLDYVLSPQCISTATQIQITFCVFPQNLFHICLHLLTCDFLRTTVSGVQAGDLIDAFSSI